MEAVDSYEQSGRPLATPHLEFAYKPQDFRAFRETGELWKWTTPEGPPEPAGIAPIFRPR